MTNEKKYKKTIIAFQALMSQLRRQRAPILDQLNISGADMAILSGLYRHGTCSRIKLADHLGLRSSALGRPLERLVKLKLIDRAENTTNRRFIDLELTKKGSELAKCYRKKMSVVWDCAFKNMADHKLEQFSETLNEIASQLEEKK